MVQLQRPAEKLVLQTILVVNMLSYLTSCYSLGFSHFYASNVLEEPQDPVDPGYLMLESTQSCTNGQYMHWTTEKTAAQPANFTLADRTKPVVMQAGVSSCCVGGGAAMVIAPG